MADISSPISRRVSFPAADGLYVPTPMMYEPSRRTPSPKLAYTDRRDCQQIRRSSLEPVLEGEVRTSDNRRHNVGHDSGSALPRPNLAKPRAPNSGRPAHSKSTGLRRDFILRSESLLSVEVKTNVVITNEYLFMNELTHHLSIRYSRPISSIAISLQHGMCLLFGGSFEPAYIMTITALADQVKADTNRRNAALFQSHLQQALRVTPTRGLVLFVPIVEEFSANGGAAAMGASVGQGLQGHDDRNGGGRRSKSLTLREPASMTSMLSQRQDKTAPPVDAIPPTAVPTASVDMMISPEMKTSKKRKSFMHSLFMRSQKEVEMS
ncbi:hypothetical protein H634G_07725 [Metarhizium anisopliae BRIP 53293]|uniref:L-dopachrome isomerase n=1 Tax=Metarhizium anisopliae BRIP 53293 TaxID=1291518 RepID=A0A0D9NRS6_METAN|nr:hypothetical protein H634G_07725 [Metarhizium anisopliae BRIP 53293]